VPKRHRRFSFLITELTLPYENYWYTISIMLFISVAHNYLLWHYSRAFLEIFHIWLNFLWFIIHLFSIPQLLRSWIAPFKRITEERKPGFSLENIATVIIINIVSRLIGFFIRTIIMVLGVTVLGLVVAGGFLSYVLWLVAPVLIIGLTALGLALIVIAL